ncbi:arsenate reductase/protein-tyrosine-phosphatase family protein [Allosediminivita pacifica]|uniref:ArsR family transcriptional regulator n=1 Tax=Allosediminivita pacifica TaxID=1267769 RepID=A0A2T5ZW04_9RHOB|nr:helix-turn-helix domain-containing protein [Allosediminivita pacifica]PTX35746.1 ArsR family transcriptional regulator [Allosediminivita pacifica]GGB31111.1 ArsR family transcriptional regulator [Allosediminivita pacifica]
MESLGIIAQLTTLGHPQRLAIFRLLVRRAPDALSAGEVAAALSIKPSTLSSYLGALTQAGLVTQRRKGTSLLYGVNLGGVQTMIETLFLDCCRGRPDLCLSLTSSLLDGAITMSDRKFNVLFICTGNSARSIFAESILREEAGDQFEAFSAGTRPYSELNPFALTVLKDKGHDVSALRAKNVSEFQGPDAPVLDFVFTVCDQAANEDCPAWSGQPISAHWGMPDPVKADGTEAQKGLAFQHAYGVLRNRILAFAALPLETLDRISLQKAVDRIAGMDTGADA